MSKPSKQLDEINADATMTQIDELLGKLGSLSEGAAKMLVDRLERIHASVQIGGDTFELRDDYHTLADLDVLDGIRRFLCGPDFIEEDCDLADAIRERDREAFMREVSETERRLSATQRQALLTGRIYLEKTRARMHELGLISSSKMQPLERPAYWIFSLTKLGMEVARCSKGKDAPKRGKRG